MDPNLNYWAILRRESKRWTLSGVLKQTLREQRARKRQKRNNADCVPDSS